LASSLIILTSCSSNFPQLWLLTMTAHFVIFRPKMRASDNVFGAACAWHDLDKFGELIINLLSCLWRKYYILDRLLI